MTTSGSTNYNTTAVEIIKSALQIGNVYQTGEEISSDDYSFCLNILNGMMKYLAISSNLWLTEEVTATLVPGTQSYTVGVGLAIDTPRPLRLKAARRRDSSGTDIEVEIVSRNDYMMLPVKSTQAPALQVYYDLQRDNGVLYVWPTGTTNNTTLLLTFQRPIQDFDSANDSPDFPQEWILPIAYSLWVRVAPSFTGAVPQDMKIEAENMLANLWMFNEEKTSLMFGPKGN